MTMKLDIDYAYKQADRFSKAPILLAFEAVGDRHLSKDTEPTRLLPVVVQDGNTLICYYEATSKRSDFDYLNPYIINAAFSLELYLKVLLFREQNTWPNGHNLSKLFKRLDASSRKFLVSDFEAQTAKSKAHLVVQEHIRTSSSMKKFSWDLEVLLKNSSNAFINWRYAFEGRTGWFAGYLELRRSLIRRIEHIDQSQEP